MATADQYADWIVKNQDKKGTPEFDTVAEAYKLARNEPVATQEQENPSGYRLESPSIKNLANNVKTLGTGAIAGAADIGDTLINASTYLPRKIESAMGGDSLNKWNENRTQGLNEFNKQNENDAIYNIGRIAGNIAGTAGVGGAAGNTLAAMSKTPQALALAKSIANSGMTGTTLNKIAGGSVSAGLGSLLVDPNSAVKGAVAGAVLPAGGAIAGKVFKPADAQKIAQVKELQNLGYALPPQDVQAGIGSQILNAVGGKIKTEQKASLLNQPITNKLAAKSLGLPEGQKITKEALASIRSNAGKDYEAVKSFGRINADDVFKKDIQSISAQFKSAAEDFPELVGDDIDKVIKSVSKDEFNTSSAVDAIRLLRDKADKAYREGDRQLGKASKSAATALEDVIERHLIKSGAPSDIVNKYKDSRKLIAKTYTIEKALNDATGNVSATKLGQQLSKGAPLDENLKKIAQFGNSFKKSAQEVQGVNPYSILDANVGGGLSLASILNPATAGVTVPIAATVASRPLARNLILSPKYQKAFVNNKNMRIADLLNEVNPAVGGLVGGSGR